MDILREFSIPEAIKANEANISGFFQVLYTTWDEAELHDEDDLLWGLTDVPSPLINNAYLRGDVRDTQNLFRFYKRADYAWYPN